MAGTLNASIGGHATVAGLPVSFSLGFKVLAVADTATAQSVLNGIKTFLMNGGAVIDNVIASFTADVVSLT